MSDGSPPAASSPMNGGAGAGIFGKTRLCRFHAEGWCSRGVACTFAHGEAEIQPQPILFKTRLCSAYFRLGECTSGSECGYAHSREEMRRPYIPSRRTIRVDNSQEAQDAKARDKSKRVAGSAISHLALDQRTSPSAAPTPQQQTQDRPDLVRRPDQTAPAEPWSPQAQPVHHHHLPLPLFQQQPQQQQQKRPQQQQQQQGQQQQQQAKQTRRCRVQPPQQDGIMGQGRSQRDEESRGQKEPPPQGFWRPEQELLRGAAQQQHQFQDEGDDPDDMNSLKEQIAMLQDMVNTLQTHVNSTAVVEARDMFVGEDGSREGLAGPQGRVPQAQHSVWTLPSGPLQDWEEEELMEVWEPKPTNAHADPEAPTESKRYYHVEEATMYEASSVLQRSTSPVCMASTAKDLATGSDTTGAYDSAQLDPEVVQASQETPRSLLMWWEEDSEQKSVTYEVVPKNTFISFIPVAESPDHRKIRPSSLPPSRCCVST